MICFFIANSFPSPTLYYKKRQPTKVDRRFSNLNPKGYKANPLLNTLFNIFDPQLRKDLSTIMVLHHRVTYVNTAA